MDVFWELCEMMIVKHLVDSVFFLYIYIVLYVGYIKY